MTKIKEAVKCLECKPDILFKDQKSLIRHIKKEHLEFTYEMYCIKHFYDGVKPTCKCGCGTEMKFESHSNPNFFSEYTKNHWPHKKHTKETKEKIKVNGKKALMDKYGVDNPMKRQESVEQIAKTKQERYGNPGWNNPEKIREIKLSRSPEEIAETNRKLIETNMKNFGAVTFTATPQGKSQVKQTLLKNHGSETYINVDLIKQVKMEKYGYGCEFSNPEWRRIYNGKTSKIESETCKIIGAVPKFSYMNKEYDMIIDKYIIEVDGDYYHPKKLENMNIHYQLNNSINDYIKTKNLQNSEFDLVRISHLLLRNNFNKITLEYILSNRYFQDFSVKFEQPLISSSEIEQYIEKYGTIKLSSKIQTAFRFFKTLEPEYINLIPETAMREWKNEQILKELVSKCFGIHNTQPMNLSLKNMIDFL